MPNYFIGRTRTADGLLGDPVNMGLIASKKSLTEAMKSAGWVEAQPMTFNSIIKMSWYTVRGKDYPDAPFSDLFLFDRRQDLGFQKQVEGNPRKRHHVRFWKTDKDWYLPGGHKVDWVGAASYDSAVGLSLFTWQFTHRIDPNIDDERDYLISTIEKVKKIKKTVKIDHFFEPFVCRNGGGDEVVTNGSMAIIKLK